MLRVVSAGDQTCVSLLAPYLGDTIPADPPWPPPGHAAVLCSELCKLGPGLKYGGCPGPGCCYRHQQPGCMSRIPAITGRNGPKYSLSLLGPQLLAGPGLDTPAAARMDLALSSLFWEAGDAGLEGARVVLGVD